jgi:hypothetical protein
MKPLFLLGLVAVATAAPLGVASSAPEPAAPIPCFGSDDIVNWTAPGNRTLNLRLRDGSVIQGVLRGPCPSFNTGDTIAFAAKARRICRGSDLQVIAEVSRVRHADDTQVAACGFTRFRKLSVEELAALPSQSRP